MPQHRSKLRRHAKWERQCEMLPVPWCLMDVQQDSSMIICILTWEPEKYCHIKASWVNTLCYYFCYHFIFKTRKIKYECWQKSTFAVCIVTKCSAKHPEGVMSTCFWVCFEIKHVLVLLSIFVPSSAGVGLQWTLPPQDECWHGSGCWNLTGPAAEEEYTGNGLGKVL